MCSFEHILRLRVFLDSCPVAELEMFLRSQTVLALYAFLLQCNAYLGSFYEIVNVFDDDDDGLLMHIRYASKGE